ncbi:xaa-Pro aminopeptidase 3-like isoform X2 [Paramacrobiotus metropolitanus]|nr:xaa-Pro aminopeptidase 3-like isoform X2 [Paramacrobiotus metropolitanus]
MAKDVPYVFRQNSNFRYLCGITEPDCLLVLHSMSPSEYRSHVFVPQHPAEEEVWHGKSLTENQIHETSGVDFVHALSDLECFLDKSLKTLHGTSVGLWCDPVARLSRPAKLDDSQLSVFPALDDFLLQKSANFIVLGTPTLYIQECRLVKSLAEVELMRCSAEISVYALKSAMQRTHSGMSERQLWALLDNECINLGADRLAFPPVCASGSRAATIHYIKNSEVMEEGTMVLVDTGCEIEGYCSDVSRVWPVDSGTQTDAQAQLVEIVLWVQQTILKQLFQLGNNYAAYPTLDNLYHRMLELLARQLRQHDLLLPRTSDHSRDTAIVSKHFCPHHLSHYLGMDIHDCSDVSRSRPLQEGMTFTIEPGLYIAEDSQFAPLEYRGIGVRIEDDIYLGPQGPEVLTKGCPSSLSDISNLRCEKFD